VRRACAGGDLIKQQVDSSQTLCASKSWVPSTWDVNVTSHSKAAEVGVARDGRSAVDISHMTNARSRLAPTALLLIVCIACKVESCSKLSLIELFIATDFAMQTRAQHASDRTYRSVSHRSEYWPNAAFSD
jgi:hypothetical protein